MPSATRSRVPGGGGASNANASPVVRAHDARPPVAPVRHRPGPPCSRASACGPGPRFLASIMSIIVFVSSAGGDGQPHEPARLGGDRRLAKLQRVHLAEPLEAGDADLALLLLLVDAFHDGAPLDVVDGVEHLLADRRCGRAAASRCRRAPPRRGSGSGARRARRGGSRCGPRRSPRRRGCRPCRSGARERSSEPGSSPIATEMSCTSWEPRMSARLRLPGVQDLAPERHDRLELPVARLLGRAPGRVPLDEEELGAREIGRGAVGELAGERRPARDLLPRDLLARAPARLGRSAMTRAASASPLSGVAVEPLRGVVLDDVRDVAGALARGQPLLRLPGELRVLELDRQHVGDTVPDVLGCDLHPARQEVPEVAELADRVGQAPSGAR